VPWTKARVTRQEAACEAMLHLGMASKPAKPRCIIIAGPNGSGKTTFARNYLRSIAGLIHFINADLIAGGISPLSPDLPPLLPADSCCANY
jgi:hypothetical protein